MIRVLSLFVLFQLCTGTAVAQKAAAIAADPRELHLVALHETPRGGQAEVRVDRPGKTVTLVLAAYNSIRWNVSATGGTKIDKVILGGYHRQGLQSQLLGAEVVDAFYEARSPGGWIRSTYSMEDAGFRPMIRQVSRLAGQRVRSFQGAYRSEGGVIVVDREQAEPRLDADYPKPTPARDLPSLEFTALHFVPIARHQLEASVGEFTLAGPKVNSLRSLPERTRAVVRDPASGKHYGIVNQDVVEIDPATRNWTKIEAGVGEPRLAWPASITLDTKRRRLLVATLSNFVAYSLETKQWTVLAERRGVVFNALAYVPDEDMIYALGQDMMRGSEGRGGPSLFRLSAEGVLVRTTQLPAPMVSGIASMRSPVSAPAQMIAVKGHLVVLATPGGVDSSENVEHETLMYLVDPKTDQVRLTWKN